MLMELVEAVADHLRTRSWSLPVEIRHGLWSDRLRQQLTGPEVFVAPEQIELARANRGAWMWRPRIALAATVPLEAGRDATAAVGMLEELCQHAATVQPSGATLELIEPGEVIRLDDATAIHAIRGSVSLRFWRPD